MSHQSTSAVNNQLKRSASQSTEASTAKKMMASMSPVEKMPSILEPDAPSDFEFDEKDLLPDDAYVQRSKALADQGRAQQRERAIIDNRCDAETLRLLDERRFPLTRSGSKYTSIGVDPIPFNEPVLRIRQRMTSGHISFDITEFEEFLAKLDEILNSIEDVDSPSGKTIASLKTYDVILLPHRVIKFSNGSDSNLCLVVDTLRVFTYMGRLFLSQLYELKKRVRQFHQFEFFAVNLATATVRASEERLNEQIVFKVISELYSNSFSIYEMYSKFYYHVHREVAKIVSHMQERNTFY